MQNDRRAINIIFRVLTFYLFKKLYSYYVQKMNGGYPPMYIYPRDTAGWATVAWGVWERWNIEVSSQLIEKYLKINYSSTEKVQHTGNLGLDIGANIGIYTVNLASKFDKLVAIEANPVISKVLQANVATNQLESLVDIRIIALGNDELEHKMYINLMSSGLSSFETVTKGVIKETTIQMHLGDTVLTEHYNSFRLTFIKCDVEGYELNVMKGLNGWLNRDHPLIQLEHDGRIEKSKEVLSYLNSIGYRFMYAREGGIPKALRGIFASGGYWPSLKRISRADNKFYQAIWLSHIDLMK